MSHQIPPGDWVRPPHGRPHRGFVGRAAASRSGGLSASQGRVGVNVFTASEGRDMLFNDPDGWEIERPWLWYDAPAEGAVLGNPPPGSGEMRRGLPAAVRRATSIIADGLAGMPWQVFQGQVRLDTPDWLSDPPPPKIMGPVGTSTVAPSFVTPLPLLSMSSC